MYSKISELDISLSDLLSMPINEKYKVKSLLELKVSAGLIATWRYAQLFVQNLHNGYHRLFAKL